MSKSMDIKINLSSYLDLNKDGVNIVNYLDINKEESEAPVSILYTYPEWKHEIISSYVIIEKTEGQSFKDAIFEGNYKVPNEESSFEILEEIKKLREFAENLEKEFESRILKK